MAAKFLDRLAQALGRGAPPRPGASSSGSPLGPGAVLRERYILDSELGRGGMGVVYQGWDQIQNRAVAIKVIHQEAANALAQQQFTREAQIMTGLHHPHIVAVYETGTLDDGTRAPLSYIVMEHVRGTSLDTLHHLTYAQIIDLAGQICEALEYAHQQGYVHRDLKPANVLLEQEGRRYSVKLADFGLARPRNAENLPAESNLAGTIYYLAPEVIAGHPADIASDLYALGAMLYEMITGRVPFSDFIDSQAILAQHLYETVAPPSQSRSDIPPPLEALVLRLLAKSPAERLPSAQAVRQALDDLRRTLAANATPGNLPSAPDIGPAITQAAAQIRLLIETSPLVTVQAQSDELGLTVGAQLQGQFTDGIWWVDLHALTDPASVLPAVTAALAVPTTGDRPLTVSLMTHLREKNLLLILAHGEAVLSACVQLVGTVLAACPEVRILAVSQTPLRLPAEHRYPPESE